MKFTAVAALLSLCSVSLAASHTGNYNAQAATVDRQSFNVKPGKYRFVNAKTKQGLKYVKSGQSIYAAPGKGDWMTIRRHEKHVIITPANSNSKCLSAAWSYKQGADGSAALYACRAKRSDVVEGDVIHEEIDAQAVDLYEPESRLAKKSNLAKRVALRLAKQYFYVHPGPKNNCIHIVASDHLNDQQTRVVSGSSSPSEWNKKIRYANIVQLNEKDLSQCWYLYNSKGQQVKF